MTTKEKIGHYALAIAKWAFSHRAEIVQGIELVQGLKK
jgi:hypothetical protein